MSEQDQTAPARRALARKMRVMSRPERLRYLGYLYAIWQWRHPRWRPKAMND